MTVVIHEFEVVTEPAPPAQQQSGAMQAGAATPPTPAPMPQDMERIVRHLVERLARVRAY